MDNDDLFVSVVFSVTDVNLTQVGKARQVRRALEELASVCGNKHVVVNVLNIKDKDDKVVRGWDE